MNDNRQITKRSVIYVTKICNIKCKFCYYRYEENLSHAPFDSIERTFQWFRRDYDIEYVDITGGEPTIHPQIVDIVKSSVNNHIKPTIITNAQKPRIFPTLIEAGLEDLLISIHGTPEHHNEVVRKKDAFQKIEESLDILRGHQFGFRTNTVLTRYSCPDIDAVARYLIKIRPRIVNLIAFNPHEGSLWKDKVNLEFQISYTQQAEAAKHAVDLLGAEGIWVNVRYIPLCFMKGYEQHVCNFMQWQFDPYEWECFSSNRIGGEQMDRERAEANETNTFGHDDNQRLHTYHMQQHIKANRFVGGCVQCANRHICDGIYPQYLNAFGEDEFRPTEGQPHPDPLVYRVRDMAWARLK